MAERVFVRSAESFRSNCEKLYLDAVTADVKFVFEVVDTAQCIEIQAHKNILSVNSPVFHAMFYGPIKEGNAIRIMDASPSAFTEFLQFFYLNTVRLTSNNIIEVAYLCNKYEVARGLQVCEIPLQESVTDDINNICSEYQAVLLLQIDSVIKVCENAIADNAKQVLESSNFLECNHATFQRILKLVASKCAAATIVNAGIAWAKAQCRRNQMILTTNNLKTQLQGSIGLMPFDRLTAEQFSQHIQNYNGLLSCEELQAIVVKTLSQKRDDNGAKSSATVLDCDRSLDCESVPINTRLTQPSLQQTVFSTNVRLLLTEFYIAETTLPMNITCSTHVFCKTNKLIFERCTLIPGKTTHVVLSQPILVQPNIKYAIGFVAQ